MLNLPVQQAGLADAGVWLHGGVGWGLYGVWGMEALRFASVYYKCVGGSIWDIGSGIVALCLSLQQVRNIGERRNIEYSLRVE